MAQVHPAGPGGKPPPQGPPPQQPPQGYPPPPMGYPPPPMGYPPPPMGYPPPPGYAQQPVYGYPGQPVVMAGYQPVAMPTTIVVQQQPVMVCNSPEPVAGVCPACGSSMTTVTNCTPGSQLLIWFVVLLILFLFTGIVCCCLPWIIPTCYDYRHRCSCCGAHVGTYHGGC